MVNFDKGDQYTELALKDHGTAYQKLSPWSPSKVLTSPDVAELE